MLEFITRSFAISMRLVEEETQILQHNVLNDFLDTLVKHRICGLSSLLGTMDIIHCDHALLLLIKIRGL